MTPEETAWSAAYRPHIDGWAIDILPWYNAITPSLPKGCVVAEVGCYHGRSLAFLAEHLRALKHDASSLVIGVDMPVLDPNGHDVLRRNVEATRHAWEPVRLALDLRPSVEAAASYPTGHFDLVFIDASHEEEDVRADITAWSRTVKKGGILSGHDYYGAPGSLQHPGVKKAVDALLGEVQHQDSVWWLTVT